jgi:hypothetical protein
LPFPGVIVVDGLCTVEFFMDTLEILGILSLYATVYRKNNFLGNC